jgi:hypothetical protein
MQNSEFLVLWCSVLQCSGLVSREFVSDVMARRRGSLVVCVCGGCFVYRVDSVWVWCGHLKAEIIY